ncbi:DivIVA domain-containing protein [Laceyella sacchari]|jgi:DivIVA domain-containing protein|uniref:DivIVA domain-containing protein n=1 Tax=Laceyella sacchari TaxID=37482 RepID=A0ABY5TZG4_LACSH|nr:DivIVA domain-containing protein [Laceyella sacchari]TCW37646.1 DivIVA domain-containing protein [Laceyella sacchari]UWE02797.1 DivIVA domain-containing protein [Laceyella sacchari]
MKRITPMEIFNKDFKHAIRGYDIEEVNEFLDLIIKSYEDVLQENEYLKEQLKKAKSAAGRRTGNTAPHAAVGNSGGEYDEVIKNILNRLEHLESLVLR